MAETGRAHLVVAAAHLDRIDGILLGENDDRAALDAVAPELAAALDAVAQVDIDTRIDVIDNSDLLELGRLRDRLIGADAGASNSADGALRKKLAAAIIEFEADVHDLIADIDDSVDDD